MATQGYVELDDFLTEVLPYIHGAPTIIIKNFLKGAIIDFCKRTQILKKQPASFYLNEDQASYTMKFPDDRYLAVSIDQVQLGESGNTILYPTSEERLDGSNPTWRLDTSSTPSNYILATGINELIIYPKPSQDSDDEIYVTARVTPRQDQTEFDEVLHEKWLAVISAGALSKLLLQPGATWFNPQLAATFKSEFKRGIRNARKTTLSATGQNPDGVARPQSFIVFGG